MGKIEENLENGKREFAGKTSKLKGYFAPILKFSLAVALFVVAAFAISGAGVVVEDGSLNVSSNLSVNVDDLFVDSVAGRVGVGTGSPAVALEVRGSSDQLRISKNSTHYGTFSMSGNTLSIAASPAGDPSASKITLTGVTTIRDPHSANTDGGDDLTLETWDSGYWGASMVLEDAYGPGERGKVNFYTTAADSLSKVLRMRLGSEAAQGNSYIIMYEPLTVQKGAHLASSSGSVGIGTTSPTHKLHVVGSQNLTGTLYYGALQAQSPHAFINNDGKSRTEICIVADDGVVVLQYLKNVSGSYQWVFEPNSAECLDKEVITDVTVEYEEVYDETLGRNVTVETSRTEVKKKVFS